MSKNKYVSTKEKSERMANDPNVMRPCPFCGKKAEIVNHALAWVDMIAVGCSNKKCKVTVVTGFERGKKAIEIWNKRA